LPEAAFILARRVAPTRGYGITRKSTMQAGNRFDKAIFNGSKRKMAGTFYLAGFWLY
jgi:hypothetical protein